MASPNDAFYDGIEVSLIVSETPGCGADAFYQWFKSANVRINLPRTITASTSVSASELPDNLTRIDSTGAIYTPAVKRYTIPEKTVQFSDTDAPGTEQIVNIDMSGSQISDLENALVQLKVNMNPSSAAINQSAVTVSGTSLQVRFTRQEGLESPYTPVTISVRGIVYEFPQSEPAA